MELIQSDSMVARALAKALSTPLTLLDVGCAGGIDPGWVVFGDKLKALAFDISEAGIAALQQAETRPSVRYVHGMVCPSPQGPQPRPVQSGNPISRFSSWPSLDVQAGRPIETPPQARQEGVDLDPVLAPVVYLPDLLAAEGAGPDFVKMDIDGADLQILRSLQDSLRGALGVGVEVTFCGSDNPDENTFHNTDRLMRSLGFHLFGLTVRRYSVAALPFPYDNAHPNVWTGIAGRPYQGDALYLRDPLHKDPGMSDDQLRKLAALFALFGLTDHAAELLIAHTERLGVDTAMLDLLADEIQTRVPVFPQPLSYADYMAAFHRDDPAFYGHDKTLSLGYSIEYAYGRLVRAETRAEAQEARALAAEARVAELEAQAAAIAAAPPPKRSLFGFGR